MAVVLLLIITLERLFELGLSRRNTRRLMSHGATEHSPRHYPFIVALHVAWLAGLWFLGPGNPVNFYWLAGFGVLQILRIWVLGTLGDRWTTRIIVPQSPLVRTGPYRYLSHPNYVIVAGEIAVLPLVFGLGLYALIFSLLNGVLLAVRIRAENAVIAGEH